MISASPSLGVPIAPRSLEDLAARHGGTLRNGAAGTIRHLTPVAVAASGDLAPLFASRTLHEAHAALQRGAVLLVDQSLAEHNDMAGWPAWVHPYAAWALAELLDVCDSPPQEPLVDPSCQVGVGALLLPRVRVGARVVVMPGAVIGAPGFALAKGPGGTVRDVPHLGGVVIEDDVQIGPLCTIAAGTLGPTIVRRGARLDAHVHIGHNCDIGENTIIAAQSGLAGSVVVGKNVLVGAHVSVADYVCIGDEAKVAAQSGVMGDIAAGATVGGYPAVERHRWLRGLAELYRLAGGRPSTLPPSLRSTPPPDHRTPSVTPGPPDVDAPRFRDGSFGPLRGG